MDRLKSLSELNSFSARSLASVDLRAMLSARRAPSTRAAVPNPIPESRRTFAVVVALLLLSSAIVIHGSRPAEAASGISFRGVSSGANGGKARLTVKRPSRVGAGDVMIASIVYREWPRVTAPAGWSFIRRDPHAQLYYRVATDHEPRSYTWRFSQRRRAVGVIAAYRGVDPAVPINGSGGRWNRPRSGSIKAPSIKTTVPGTRLIGVFGALVPVKIARPGGMTHRVSVKAWAWTKMSAVVSDMTKHGQGPTGRMVARAGRSVRGIGQLVALTPVDPPPPPPPPDDPYRPFSNDSYWNTRLPSNAPIDPSSRNYIAHLKTNRVGNFVMLSGADRDGSWGTPIYWAKRSDPTYNVKSSRYYVPPEFKTLRIPRGAKPDPTSDAEMMVYDLDKGYVAALWLAKYDRSSDTWTAGGGDVYYVASNGLDGRLPQSDEPRNTGSHRGAAPPIFAIRWDEIQAGSINHVIKVAIPGPHRSFVFPMTGSDGHNDDPKAPPEGARFRLKRSIDLDSMRLTPAQYAVAKAAQEYGFVVTDASGAPVAAGLENVVAEGRGWLWDGILAWDSLRIFRLDDYEFIKRGFGS